MHKHVQPASRLALESSGEAARGKSGVSVKRGLGVGVGVGVGVRVSFFNNVSFL